MSSDDTFAYFDKTVGSDTAKVDITALGLAEGASNNAFSRQLPITRYDHRKGLKSLQVHQSLTSLDGRIWSATPSGLACYDGVKMRMFDRRHGLSSHGLRCIAIQSDNTLWIGTDIGVEVLDISGFTPAVLWSRHIGTVNCIDLAGDTGAIGTSSGLFMWQGGTDLERCRDSHLSSTTIMCVLVKNGEDIWAGGPAIGVVKLGKPHESFTDLNLKGLLGPPSVIAESPNGEIYIGGAKGLASIDVHGGILSVSHKLNQINALLFCDGLIWIGSGSRLLSVSLQDNTFIVHDIIRTDISVLHLMRDEFGNIWVSTGDQALLSISGMRKTFSSNYDANIGPVMCIRYLNDELFIGGLNGWGKKFGPSNFDISMVWDILADDFGKVWLATEHGLFCKVTPTLTIPYRHRENAILTSPCRALAFFNGKLYIGSIRGLAVIDSKGVSEVLTAQGDSLGYVYSLHNGPNGRLWIATLGQGAYRLDAAGVMDVVPGNFDKGSNVYAFSDDGAQRVFIAHDQYISQVNLADEAKILVQAEAAIAAWALRYLDGNRLIAGSSNGLVIYDTSSGDIRNQVSGSFDDIP